MTEQAEAAATPIIPADATGIAAAVAVLRSGGVVALPSETVYGLAADATSPAGVAGIYAAKGRPQFNPLIIHVSGMAMAEQIVRFSALARQLADCFWPGPLTLVLPRKRACPIASLATAGIGTVAIRWPAHPVMQAVITAAHVPLAAPSANRSGRLSPTTAGHVAASLGGRIPLILDGGATTAGIESTIVSVDSGRLQLLREGPITAEALASATGVAVKAAAPGTAILAPGQLASHYAPRQPMRLGALTAEPGEILIGFGPVAGTLSLSARGDLNEAAMRLFDVLHQAEATAASRIAVAPVPLTGLGAAINDRLRRAAAPRDYNSGD